MYHNPAVTATLRTKYAAGFAVLDACITLGDEFGAAMTTGRTLDTAAEAALGTIFTRFYNTLCAATILLEDGYGIEAGMLTRGFLESFYNIAYITQFHASRVDTKEEIDANYLGQRFINYQHVAKYLAVEHAEKAKMTLRPNELADALKERQEQWDAKYGWRAKGEPNFRDWSGLHPEPKAERGNVVDVYLWLNRHFSEMVHGGPDAWRQLVVEEEDNTAFLTGPQDIYIEMPMPALGLLFSLGTQLMAEYMGLDDIAKKAGQVHDEVKQAFGVTIEETP